MSSNDAASAKRPSLEKASGTKSISIDNKDVPLNTLTTSQLLQSILSASGPAHAFVITPQSGDNYDAWLQSKNDPSHVVATPSQMDFNNSQLPENSPYRKK